MSDKKISQLTAATTPLAGTEVLPIVQSGSTVKASIANVQAAPVSAGTANAVQFLNASKVPSTSGNLFWNGTLFAIGERVIARLSLKQQAANNSGGIGIESFANDSKLSIYSDGTKWKFENGASVTGSFLPFAFTSSGVDRLSIANAGDVTVNTGNLVIGTAGKGIDFSADGSAAGMTSELLDDYEEGTFTPVASGSTSAGAGTYSAQSGKYTKIGRAVTFTLNLAWSAHTGTGNLVVSGLPFTVGAGNGFAFSIASDSLAYSNQLVCQISGGATNIELFQQSNNAAWVPVAMDTSIGYLIITGQYFV